MASTCCCSGGPDRGYSLSPVANRGLAWLIGAPRLIRGPRMHRINLTTRIHHAIRADPMRR